MEAEPEASPIIAGFQVVAVFIERLAVFCRSAVHVTHILVSPCG